MISLSFEVVKSISAIAFSLVPPNLARFPRLKHAREGGAALKVRNALPLATLNPFKVGWQISFASGGEIKDLNV